MGKWCLHASLFLGNKDMFKNYKRFDIWHVQKADIGGTKPWKNNCSLIWKLFKFLMTLLGLFIKVAGNQDRHKSSVEFGPLVSMAHLYVFLYEIWPWHIGERSLPFGLLVLRFNQCRFTIHISVYGAYGMANCVDRDQSAPSAVVLLELTPFEYLGSGG